MVYICKIKITPQIFRMKRVAILVLMVLAVSCRTTSFQTSGPSLTRQEYIRQYAPVAVQEMNRTGIPASIKLAQAILESGDGNSTLARRANNHFGIKCHDWKGARIYHDDDARGECFRKYRSPEESFRDHSDFLTGRARYASLFELNPTDYKAWAAGLKRAGYATNPNYDRMLIRIIEENQLMQYDNATAMRRAERTTPRYTARTTSSGTRLVDVRNNIRYIEAKEGDSFAGLAREMNLMPWELPKYNESPADRILSAGEIIYLQPKRNRAERGNDYHVVQEGETLYGISQLYGVKLERLFRMNSLSAGYEPAVGEKIWLRRNRPVETSDEPAPKIEFEL